MYFLCVINHLLNNVESITYLRRLVQYQHPGMSNSDPETFCCSPPRVKISKDGIKNILAFSNVSYSFLS
jgi:hypothetical protein